MSEAAETKAPFADTPFLTLEVDRKPLQDGGWLMTCPTPLAPYPDHVLERLHHWAETAPDRDFLCERDASGEWRRVTYAEAARAAAGIAQSLLTEGHGPDRPVAILSDNSVDFGLFLLGAMRAGIAVMPVSPAYSLMSQDHAKLKAVVQQHDPSAIFVGARAPFEKALSALDMSDRTLVTATAGDAGAVLLGNWMATAPGNEAAAALASITPDTVAKILLTSGSTGMPKGVINTQRMICSNQVMMAQVWQFAEKRPPVLMDWLPWNHTFGGNFNFNFVLFHGGTYYIDEGRPVPGRLDATLRNLEEISPTVYLNVPKGFEMMMPELERNAALRDSLFKDLDMIFFAGAALPHELRARLEALSAASRGVRVPIVTSLGSTETAPAATMMCWDSDAWGNIGLPLPGTELKLIPNGAKLEVRMKGPHITPGYNREPELTADAFDEDGFFGIGDAGKFLDDDDPSKGILFDGRVAENFKLLSGTWVAVGTLRIAAIDAAAPLFQDAVVTGHDRQAVGLLAFVSPAGAKALCPEAPDDASLVDLIARPEITDHVVTAFKAHNSDNPGSSTRVTRVLLMTEPPQIDASEITDKGYINQRAVIERRAGLIEALYAADRTENGIVLIQ